MMRRKRPSKKKACVGKKVYPNRAAAEVELRRLSDAGGGGLRIYTCPHCKRLHIGHTNKNRQGRIAS